MTVKQTVTALDTAIIELTDRLARQAEQLDRATARVAELEQAAERAARRLARGTEPPVAAPRARRPTAPPDLGAMLEAALRAKVASPEGVAEALGVPLEHVAIALRTLAKAGRAVNVGTRAAPQWTLRLGDEGPTAELNDAVEALLRLRPMSRQELIDVLGARRTRVAGSVVHLQRSGRKIVHVGDANRGQWFILP